jgi:hypothetical protein
MGWLIVGAATAIAGCAYSYRADGTGYVEHRASPFMLWSEPIRPAPRLAADRPVQEQDCTQPLVQPTANLKCR